MKIKPNEIKIVGNWVLIEGMIKNDASANRIEELINDYLIKVAQSDDGWKILYQDPFDNRFWELTYPQSEYHGGGPPMLENIPEKEREKYNKI